MALVSLKIEDEFGDRGTKRRREDEPTIAGISGEIPDSKGDHQSPKRMAKPQDVLFRIVVSSRQIGKVIGKGGSRIQMIREETRAMIKIADAIAPYEERVIIISSVDNDSKVSDAETALHLIGRIILMCWEMAPRPIDVGWMYCTKINNNRLQTKYNFCDTCHYGGGVTRHKQHLAGGYANVQKCTKCPLEISRKMQEHLARSRAKGNQREDDDERLTEQLMEDIDEYRGSDLEPDDEDVEMVAAMRASREEARAHEWEMRHGMRRSQSYRPGEGSGSATPSSRRKGKSERVEAFCRSASVKEMFEMFKDSGKGKTKSTDKGKKKKSPDIRDMTDPAAYRPRGASQRRIEESLKSHSLRARMGRAISRWFHSALIPAHKAKDPHFKAMVREIQKCGPNVTPPTPYEISGTYLDEVVVEVKEYIERFKKKWPEYGVTIMCDGWSGPTRLSIINFLVFCDGRTIFHKSVYASAEIKDAAYLYRLMDEVVEEIGEENIVQIVTENAANFKKADLSLMQKRQHIYWIPCAAHCIDLIFKDIGEIKKIQGLVSDARRITNFIYNHTWVLALMRSHTLGDLVRPASTRFATNYVALVSLLERIDGLVQMFTSHDWFCSTYASSEPGRYVQDLVTSTRFWAKIRRVTGLMQPLFSILREVDGDKDQTMGILMDRMLRAMMTIVQLNTSESQKVAKIIDSRLDGMLLQDIHRAASYLNPNLQYQDARLGYDVEMLDALRRVINRIEPDTIRAAAAVDEDDDVNAIASVGVGQVTLKMIRLLISGSQAGCLIGMSGQNIEKLRNSSGANIMVLAQNQFPMCASAHESDRLVQISGDTPTVLKALEEIGSLLRENPPRRVVSVKPAYNFNPNQPYMAPPSGHPFAPDYVTLELMLPETMVGGFIGKCGCNISKIRTESGATVKVAGGRGEQAQRLIQLSGNTQQVAWAKKLVDDYIYSQAVLQQRRQ